MTKDPADKNPANDSKNKQDNVNRAFEVSLARMGLHPGLNENVNLGRARNYIRRNFQISSENQYSEQD